MVILMFLSTMLASRANLLIEILALRQQLAVLKRPENQRRKPDDHS